MANELEQPMGMPQEGMPQTDPNQNSAPISDAQRQELLDRVNDVSSRLNESSVNSKASAEQVEAERISLLRSVLEMLERMGVDLEDPNSIREFVNKLREMNPDLAAQFEQAMEALLGPVDENESQSLEGAEAAPTMNPMQGESPMQPNMTNETNMNPNEDLSQGLR